MLDKEEVFNNMTTSNEYKVLKAKINRLEDSIREMKRDIKDIKMVLESLPHDEAKEIATKNLQKYGLIGDDGNIKVNINKSSKEANKEQTELGQSLKRLRYVPSVVIKTGVLIHIPKSLIRIHLA